MDQTTMKEMKRYQVKPGFIHRRVAGNEVLISVGQNIANFNGYITLNSTAAFLWDEMKKPVKAEALAAAMAKAFEVSAEEAAKDVQEYIEFLMEHDMISIVG